MSQSDSPPPGPDLSLGVPLSSVPASGVLAGHVNGEAVLLARLDDGIFAVGGTCTHYGAPLAEGLARNGEIRCPWHHACFSLRSGAALKAPAFAPLATWQVETTGDQVFVRGRTDNAGAKTEAVDSTAHPRRIVTVAPPPSPRPNACADSVSMVR